jgi:hypothetical protein
MGLALAVSLAFGLRVRAEGNRAGRAQALEEYAAQNKLPLRKVMINLPGRQAERSFVPITPATFEDFMGRFTEKQGCFVWRHLGRDSEHAIMCFDKGQHVRHYTPPFTDLGAYIGHNAGGYCMVIEPPDVGALRQFWTTYHPNNQQQFMADRMAGKYPEGGCMWWLIYSEADANRTPLAHTLGVNRSKAPSNLFKKLMHAGNDRVGPVGIIVPDVEAFNKMTDVQLMGPGPGGGAAEAVK